ncbi:MAG: UDP-3-O-(3-hydroxymyristoyl)glucosamine N-acyltransferase [Syntrophobacterales bacterium]|nr:MAG: UDP-3-O-(3-hydroxymyristoyl)glucosamine N-acyltransferase [Syntrophobacterales bacterium]
MEKMLSELAQLVGGEVIGDGGVKIIGVAPIEEARKGEITFIAHQRYLPKLNQTEASAVIVSLKVSEAEKPLLRVANPYLAFAKILQIYAHRPYESRGVDQQAWVSPTAKLGEGVSIYPFVYVGDHTEIGNRVIIFPGAFVGDNTIIGDDSLVYPNVCICEGSRIGKRVILHCGVVIGSDGFGFAKDGKRSVKIPQVGIVEIGDDVEIGANTTVDRAAMGKTIIKRGVKIDNLVQVAHTVTIGEDSIIVAQVGIAGSTKIGDNVIIAGQVGVSDHIEIGDNVMVGPQSGVVRDIPPNQVVTGSPSIPHKDHVRAVMTFPKLPEMWRKIGQLEAKVRDLEAGQNLRQKTSPQSSEGTHDPDQ